MGATAVILGAGYSSVAGLPLACDLLTSPVYIPSHKAAYHWERVRQHFAAWQAAHPGGYPEQYLGELYAVGWGEEKELWLWAVHLIVATLATPRADAITRGPRYTGLLSRPYPCLAHAQFWDVVQPVEKLPGRPG